MDRQGLDLAFASVQKVLLDMAGDLCDLLGYRQDKVDYQLDRVEMEL
jgi:hypothetical protein